MKEYGDTIRDARDAKGWTQDELAQRSGVPKRTIQEIENGRAGDGGHRGRDPHGCLTYRENPMVLGVHA